MLGLLPGKRPVRHLAEVVMSKSWNRVLFSSGGVCTSVLITEFNSFSFLTFR